MNETELRDALIEMASRGPAARRRELAAPLASLYDRTLLHFAERGSPPSPETLQAWADELRLDSRAALADLLESDLVEADADTLRVVGAYPFTSQERGHRVDIDGGPTVQAYCAIDALGVSAILNRPVTIHSHDPHSGAEITVRVEGADADARPMGTVVSVAADRVDTNEQASDSACPTVNFYESHADALAYEQTYGLKLDLLSVAHAHQVGVTVFGDLLETGRVVNGSGTTSPDATPALTVGLTPSGRAADTKASPACRSDSTGSEP